MIHQKAMALSGIASLALCAGAAHATFVPFFQITNNGNADVSGQIILEITDLGGGIVSFDLSNAGPLASTFAMFNIQDNDDLFSDMTAVIDSAGVDFEEDAPPGNLPGGNSVSFVSAWGSTAEPPPAQKGVDPGESVELRLSLAAGKTFADVDAAIISGALRGGVHVISIEEGGSESYVSNPPVPTPGTLALAAIGMIGAARRRR